MKRLLSPQCTLSGRRAVPESGSSGCGSGQVKEEIAIQDGIPRNREAILVCRSDIYITRLIDAGVPGPTVESPPARRPPPPHPGGGRVVLWYSNGIVGESQADATAASSCVLIPYPALQGPQCCPYSADKRQSGPALVHQVGATTIVTPSSTWECNNGRGNEAAVEPALLI